MKKLHVASTATLVLLAGVVSSVAPAFAQRPPNPPGLFAKHCAVCHGPQGVPNQAFAKKNVRDLQDPAWQDGVTNEKIAQVIREGVPKTMMAAHKDKLSSAEIDALVQFIRGLRRK